MHRGMKLPLIVTNISIIDANIAQDEIYDWCREGLDEGRHVVRLKIGKLCRWLMMFWGECVH